PIVTLGAAGLFHVGAGKTLTVTSGLTGGAGLTKNLDGDMAFDALQFYTGTTSVNDGRLVLKNRASNTLLPNNNLHLSGDAVLDLNGGSQFVAALYTYGAGGGSVPLGGSIVNSDLGRQAVLVVNSNNSYSGRIKDDIVLVKAGGGTHTFHALNDYSGATIISGGTLNLQDAGRITATSSIEINRGSLNFTNGFTALPDRVVDSAAITLKGGTLNLGGQSLAAVTETVGAVTMVDGLNQIFADDVGPGSSYTTSSAILTLSSFTRSPGSSAVVRFNNLGEMGQVGLRVGGVKITSAPTLTNGLLGPWAIIDRVFASYDATYGVGGIDRPGFPGYSGSGLNSLPADTDNVYTTQTGLVPMLANTAVGTLSINIGDADANYNLQGNTLRLRNGGLIMAQNNGNRLLTVGNGNLTAGVVGSSADLYVWHAPFGDDGRRGLLSANVVDNDTSGQVRLIVSGADGRQPHSSLTLSGTNTNTGGTVINSSTIYLDPAGRLGTGGIVVAGGVFRQSSNNALFRLPGLTTTAGSATVTTPAGGTAGLAVGMPIWGLPGATTTNMYITGINAGANTFTVTSGTGMTASTTANPYILTNAYSGNGGLIPEQTLLMAGNAQVHLTGANRLSTLTFDNGGGNGIILNAGGVLTLSGGIVATSTNATASAVIGSQFVGSAPNGTLDLDGAPAFSMNVAAASVSGRDVAPLTPTLVINSVIQNGGIAKSGNGLLQLSGQNTFTGGVNASAGGLVIGASTQAVTGGFTGPFGTGTVTMATGTRLLASAANLTVENAFAFGDDGAGTGSVVFGGLNNFNLSGSATIPSVQWNVEVTAPQTTVSLADISGELSTTVIRKSGLGFLNVGGFDGSIEADGGLSISADGNGRGTVQSVAVGGNLTVLGDLSVTVNRSGSSPFARNKVIQKADLTVPGNILSISNQSGYGLEFTGTTTMTGPSHFAVGSATASNLNSGLILSGTVTDGANAFGLIKSGPGTLELRGTNDFGGAGMTVDILGGVLAASSDAALGNASNTVTLNADGSTGVGFRALSSFTSARTFVLAQANNAFEVVPGATLTLSQPFDLGASLSRSLSKNNGGVLNLAAANATWNGIVNVNAGALRVSNSAALGTSSVNVSPSAAVSGAALELAGGVTVANALSLQGTNNVLLGGLDFGGQLSSVSGNNTYSGPISFAYDASIGVAAGSTLSLTGGLTNTGSQRYLAFNNEGTLNISSWISPSVDGSGALSFPQLYAVFKQGTGVMNVTTPQNFALDTANGQWFNVRQGSLVLSGGSVAASTAATPTGTSGTNTITLGAGDDVSLLGLKPGMFVAGTGVPTRAVITSVNTVNNSFTLSANLTGVPGALKFLTGGTLAAPMYLEQGASLVLDHRGIAVTGAENITANGRLGTSATDDRDIVFRGGLFQIQGNDIVNDDLIEYLAEPLFRRGSTVIELRKNQSGAIRLVFNNAFSPVTPNQNTTTANVDTRGSSVLFRGDSFGVNNAPGTTNVIFAGGSTLNGPGGNNTDSKAIFPWALVGRTDVVGEEFGASFATISSTAAGTAASGDHIVRPLRESEYVTNAALAGDKNMRLTDGVTRTVSANVAPNSLTISGSSNLVLNPGVRLSLVSGGLLVRNGSTVSITGGIIDQANTRPGLNIWTVGTSQLTIGSSLTGGNGVGNGRISLVKAGAGTLVLAPETAPVVGLAGLGTNSLSGQLVINEGTLKLGTGVKNATQVNNFLALMG
ncbi:MAG: beta strand repeat-containing protein, partial [Opitutia bacterium]